MITKTKTPKAMLLISYLNAIVALCVILYWVVKNLTIQQHYFEFREAFVLCLEACILIFALYGILGFQSITLKVINYVAFGLHLLAAIGILYFMLTFKMNRLF